ncbi:MAG: T9SS type A sorting domain-containing protein [Crocinitomix sp.]|nr:T9SS type A sorting domain-containing protein [Crocinitomix sp.]
MYYTANRTKIFNKAHVLSLFLVVSSFSLQAQQAVFDWVGNFEGYYHERTSCTQNAEGDVISAGSYWANPDFDPGDGFAYKVTEGLRDIFVQNWDADRNFQWVSVVGGEGHDQAYDVSTDDDGNIYVVGTFEESVDFDPDDAEFMLESSGNTDIFVLKLNPLGEFVWAQSFGSIFTEVGSGITLDDSGNLYICGSYNATVDFDFGPAVNEVTADETGNDAFVLKLSTDGDFVWVKSFGAEDADFCKEIEFDALGSLSLSGYTRSGADFDPSDEEYYLDFADLKTSSFVSKLDTDGGFLWAKILSGSEGVITDGMTTDVDGNIYIIGNFSDTIFFNMLEVVDTATAVSSHTDAFITKYEADGSYAWGRTYGGAGGESAYGIQSDGADLLYISGGFSGTTDLDPNETTATYSSEGYSDAYILKLNTDGIYIWSDAFGGEGTDLSYEVYPDGNGNIISIGSFMFDVDFDNSEDEALISLPGTLKHLYILKLKECIPADSTDYITACSNYVWSETGFLYTNTNTYTYETEFGCDSTRTLDLVINEISTVVSFEGLTIVAEQNDASYQWIDCNNDYLPIDGETNQAFSPTINGHYAVIITTEEGCTDTSACTLVDYMNIEVQSMGIQVYPNPASGVLIINSAIDLQGTYTIYNTSGEILRKSILNEDQQIFIHDLATGLYFLRFENGLVTSFSKI